MNLFGMGFLELAVIFLVTFLVMGPAKTIQMARSTGKLLGDLRKSVNDMSAAVNLNTESPVASENSNPPKAPEPPPTPTQAVPTTGPGGVNEQQP